MSAAAKPGPVRPSLEIDVRQTAAGWADALADAEATVRRAAAAAFAAGGAGLAPGLYEVSLVLTDDETIRGLNRDWRGRDAPTNVLSFPALDDAPSANLPVDMEAERLLGDVVIALETTAREATRECKTLADHLTHLAVHGMLHLLGCDHETDAEAEVMEGLEKDILSGLGVADPYADGAGAPDADARDTARLDADAPGEAG